MFGLLNICKPRGLSSYDVIRQLKGLLGREQKIGHAGTLDPAAEGVLMVCLGGATRLADWIQRYEKEYITLACLGATSTTDDAAGAITAGAHVPPPQPDSIAATLRQFIGEIQQTPPAHSAVHVEGKRAYELARAGQDVQIAPRPVTIYQIDILEYDFPRLRLRVRCASGTYIRSLVRDLGRSLGVGAYCQGIIRTRIGPFALDDALSLEGLDRAGIEAHLLPPSAAIPAEFHIVLPPECAKPLSSGMLVTCSSLSERQRCQDELAAVDAQGNLLALVRPIGDALKPVKVFVQPVP